MENYSLLMGDSVDGDGGGVDGEAFRGTSPSRRRAGTETPVPQILASRWQRLWKVFSGFVRFREYFLTRISETKNSRKQELALRHLVNRNPPASSDGQHSRAGRLPGLRLALVPPSDGPQRLGTHVRCWCKGVPPDLYLTSTEENSSGAAESSQRDSSSGNSERQVSTAQREEAALDAKTDTSANSAELETLRKELENLEERVRVTKQLIQDKEALIARSQEEAKGLTADLKTDLAEIRTLSSQLVMGKDEDDEAEIAEVDRIRADALHALSAFLQ
ncbi:hypothetical protein QYE76_040034 [Lolium multiflorum]|uniref:Uncharacterized protein n=1 Tax=Lolium multiflorum TaxID=4521 RepID=A0AAD8WUK2_LOLMU|nr:hypothetical protein QYE76_040034 [Lolium multiflorum]